jgi:GcrA cell cycle regulator
LGEPGTRSFRFCEGESVPGKPYCPDHAKLAYVKVSIPAKQAVEAEAA